METPQGIEQSENSMNAYMIESSGRTPLACIHVAENEVRNSTCLD
jgi:hypothetical protein